MRFFIFFWSLFRKVADFIFGSASESDFKTNFNIISLEKNIKADSTIIKEKLINNNINKIGVIHGTFVGNDPFGISEMTSQLFPSLSVDRKNKIENYFQNKTEGMTKDVGNFSQEYLEQMSELLPGIECERYIWSSSNHHTARLMGVIKLIEDLSKNLDDKKENNDQGVILIGHSHGGSILAILSHFLSNNWRVEEYIKILNILNKTNVLDLVESLKERKFYLVTMGTAVRYECNETPKVKFLHFVNHRGDLPIGENLVGCWNTLTGDYIQQWAVEGSDSIALNKTERILNKKLDLILGAGTAPRTWKRRISKRIRCHQKGRNILIDYEDQANILPNFHKSIFGHGVYTRLDLMYFHLKLITEELLEI